MSVDNSKSVIEDSTRGIGFILLVVIPIILVFIRTLINPKLSINEIYMITAIGLVSGLYWRLSARFFLWMIGPIYARIISRGQKYLVRFSNRNIQGPETRKERWAIAGKRANGSLILLFFMICVLALPNAEMAATGKGMETYECEDGEIILFSSVNNGRENCADGSDEGLSDPAPCPGDVCVDSPSSRVLEAFFGNNYWAFIIMTAPLITCVMAPLYALQDSMVFVVDRKSNSINPIGKKILQATNVATGFGSVIVGGRILWTFASSSTDTFKESLLTVCLVLIMFIIIFWFIYHAIWISAVIYSKKHHKYVQRFDERMTAKQNVLIHEIQHFENTILIQATANGKKHQ